MSDDELVHRPQVEILPPEARRLSPMEPVESPPGYEGILNLSGRIQNYAKRSGYLSLARTMDARMDAIDAYVGMKAAEERAIVAKERTRPENLAIIKNSATLAVRREAEDAQADLQEAMARKQKAIYARAEEAAKVEDWKNRRIIENLEFQVKKKNLEEQLHGKREEAKDPRKPEEILTELGDQASALEREWRERKDASDFTESEDEKFRRMLALLHDKMEKVESGL